MTAKLENEDITIKGMIQQIFFEDNPFYIFRIYDEKGNLLTVKGQAILPLKKGLNINCDGHFIEDKKYGLQFQASKVYHFGNGLREFLTLYLKYQSPKIIEPIVEMYKDVENPIDDIKKNPEKLKTIKGVKTGRVNKMLEAINKHPLYIQMIEVQRDFGPLTKSATNKIEDFLTEDKNNYTLLKNNPYILIKYIDGFAFKRCDTLALKHGSRFNPYRVEAALIEALKQSSQTDGHCFLNERDLIKQTLIILCIQKIQEKELKLFTEKIMNAYLPKTEEKRIALDDVKKYIDKKDSNKNVFYDFLKDIQEYYRIIQKTLLKMSKSKDSDNAIVIDEDRYYWKELYESEVYVSDILKQMVKKRPIKNISKTRIQKAIKKIETNEFNKSGKLILLSDEQKQAILTSLNSSISIITGGPGRGKTTIINAIISAWSDYEYPEYDENIILLAPTGRAAKRMTETTGHKAQTIHRLFGDYYRDFCCIPENSLFIVDETSMIGITLMKKVLMLARNHNIIFVGDIDQLASVEPGNVMTDMINSKLIKTSYLKKGFRNAGSIAKNAALINSGKGIEHFILDDETKFIELNIDKDMTDNEKREEYVKVPDYVLASYNDLIKRYRKEEIGILTPTRERGAGSVKNINDLFRQEINPYTRSNPENTSGVLIGDRIMCIRNDYKQALIEHTTETYFKNGKKYEKESINVINGVFNGDIGTVIEINEKSNDDDDKTETVVVEFDNKTTGEFSFREIKENFVIAYGMTIHKSQGSEYSAVIIVLTSQNSFFLTRNLVYTGITRAKKELIIVGDKNAITLATRHVSKKERNSYLKERILTI